jgi:hypothetical protein
MAGAKVIDADGHIIERSDELRGYLKSPFNKRSGPLTASEPWDRDLLQTLPPEPRTFPSAPTAQDWLRLLDDHGIEQAFLYPTALGNVSRIREPEYAAALCEAYNDYVHERYAKISDRLRPVALLPFQDPERAVLSRCMAPMAPRSWLRVLSKLSPKFTPYLSRWECSCSSPV